MSKPDPWGRTSKQVIEMAKYIHAGMKGFDQTQWDMSWLPIDPTGEAARACVVDRSKKKLERCWDARCGRCYPRRTP